MKSKTKKILIGNEEKEIIIGTQNKYKKQNMMQKAFDKRLKELLSFHKPKNVLEIGCGEGHVISIVKEMYPDCRLVAADISEDLLESSKKAGADEVVLVGAEPVKLDYEANSFDMVLMIEVLEHLHIPEKSLKEVHRLCNSYFIASVPNEPIYKIAQFLTLHNIKDFGNTPGHVNHWSKRAFIDFLTPYFQVEKVYNPYLWTLTLSKKK